MAEDNVFAPPKANLDATVDTEREAPRLWNPNVAASWSVFLSCAFGAYLHMRNWRALGEHRLADQSRIWMAVSIGVLALTIFFGVLTGNTYSYNIGRLLGFAILIAWYFVSAKAQARYVKERFDTYPKRGWLVPLLLGFAILFGAGFLIGVTAGIVRVAAGLR